MYERCCLGSPELEPMDSDVQICAVDAALRLRVQFVSHAELEGRQDCTSMFTCRATPEGWVLKGVEEPVCEQPGAPPSKLDAAIAETGCSVLEPVPATEWYEFEAYEHARLRYRFGTAMRSHCTVPNWRLIEEEPLRLYSFLRRRGGVPLSRVLVNVGAGDGSWDDPLHGILNSYVDNSTPWRGVYFEAVRSNCRKARLRLAKHGKIRLRCGYTTPRGAADAICRELGCDGRRIEVDAMNVDIDSYDCSVLREVLLVASPKILVVEVGAQVPPPLAVSAEFHPSFQEAERTNVSSYGAISGATSRGAGFWQGCSLSAVIALLWPFGLGLYRYAMLNAMFIRADVADASGLAAGGWQPADEFECWRRSCGDRDMNSLLRLTAEGVHTQLLPHIWAKVQEVAPRHPVSVAVSAPPPSKLLPRPSDAPTAMRLPPLPPLS